MDFKKIKTETTVVTRQKDQFYKGTGNIYETVAILSIRANQIASEMKAELNEKIESFEYDGMRICNFEMESSALAGMASLLGHRAMTCCMVIANRYAQKMNTEYKNSIDTLIEKVLDRI